MGRDVEPWARPPAWDVPLGACPAERARAALRSRHFPRGRRCRRGRSCPVRAAAAAGAAAAGRDNERQWGAKLRRAGNTRSLSALRGRAPPTPPFPPYTPFHRLRVAPAPLRPPVSPFAGGGASAGEERRVRRRGGVDGGGAAPRVRRPAPSWAGTARAREGQNGGPEPSGAPRPPSHLSGRGIYGYPLSRAALQSTLELLSNLDRFPLPLACNNNSALRAWRPGGSGSHLI